MFTSTNTSQKTSKKSLEKASSLTACSQIVLKQGFCWAILEVLCAVLFMLALSNQLSAQQTSCNENTVAGAEALYTFENNTADGSGNLHNPTSIGAGISFSTDSLEGTRSATYDGTGGNGSGIVIDDAFFNAAFTTRTLSMFIKPSVLNMGQQLYEEGGLNNGIELRIASGGNLILFVTEGGVVHSTSIPFPTDGDWHQVGFVYDGSAGVNQAWLYLDGYPVGAVDAFDELTAHASGASLFQQNGTSAGNTSPTEDRPYTGLMDDVAVYDSALTPKNMLDIADCAIDNLLTDLVGVTCPTSAYLVQTTSGDWYDVDLVTGESTLGSDNLNIGVNAIGFNEVDGRIWGACRDDTDTFCERNQLIITSVNADGTYTSTAVGPIAGLPVLSYVAGDVYNGVYYLSSGNNFIYAVDADPSSVTYLQLIDTITLSLNPSGMTDIAVNPVDGFAYALSTTDGNLIKIDLSTGTVTNLGLSGAFGNPLSSWGAIYFDDLGYLYTSNNNSGEISRIDLSTDPGTDYDETNTVLFSNGPASSANDGARCPGPLPIDWGDAPDSYKTLLKDDGPRHGNSDFNTASSTSALTLGSNITIESEGQPDAAAGLDGNDDGITWPTLNANATYTETVSLVNTTGADAYLNVWIDYNGNGDFLDAGEQITSDQVVANAATSAPLNFTVLASAVAGTTFARIRLCGGTGECNIPTGAAAIGEVEDYQVTLVDICDAVHPEFTDKDGDGVGDVCDLDNDNDGILDSIEFCTKQNLVFSNITQLVGTGNVNSIQEGDIYLLPDVGMQNGISFDATYEVITVDFNGGGSPVISISYAISYTTTDAIQDDYVIIKITFIESGTATAGSPTGTPIDLNDFTFSIVDIESLLNVDLSEIGGVGNAQTSDNMPITYDNLMYAAGASTQVTVGDFINDGNEPNFTLIVTDPTFAGDPTDWVDEATTASAVGRVDFEYNSLSSIEVLFGLTGSEGMVGRNLFLGASFCDIKDTDGDGTPNHCDLDSDNDGCPDALEGDGGFLYADLLNDTLTGGVDADGVPLVAMGGQADVSSTDSLTQSTVCLCDAVNNPSAPDNDGDGVGDVCDLDNDNDGILDTVECTAIAPSTNLALTGTATQSSVSTGGVASRAIDGNTNGVYAALSTTATTLETNPFWVVNLPSLSLISAVNVFNRTDCCGSRLDNFVMEILKGGAPVYTYVHSGTAEASTIITDFNVIGDAVRIRLVGVSRILSLAEVEVMGTAYDGNNDTDGDGIFNCFDLDSDNDGCPDAIEGGGTFVFADLDPATGRLTGTVDANGVPTVATPGQAVGTSTDPLVQSDECDPCNSASTQFTDKDNDGVGDVCDLDNDNDGIIDTDEGKVDDFVISFDTSNEGWHYINKNSGNDEGSATHSSIGVTPAGCNINDIALPSPTGGPYLFDHDRSPGGTFYTNTVALNEDLSSSVDQQFCFYWINGTPDGGGTLLPEMLTIVLNSSSVGIDITAVADVTGIVNSGNWAQVCLTLDDATWSGNATDLANTLLDLDFIKIEVEQVSGREASSPGSCNTWEYFGLDDISFSRPSLDTDSNGIPDYCDLDSDNDGCPDALEGDGGFLYADILNDTLTGGVDTDGVPLVAAGGQADASSTNPNIQSRECLCHPLNPKFTDKDGDGVGDVCDLDDDNDGILDTVECPAVHLLDLYGDTTTLGTPGVMVTVGDGGEGTGKVGPATGNSDGDLMRFSARPDDDIDNFEVNGGWQDYIYLEICFDQLVTPGSTFGFTDVDGAFLANYEVAAIIGFNGTTAVTPTYNIGDSLTSTLQPVINTITGYTLPATLETVEQINPIGNQDGNDVNYRFFADFGTDQVDKVFLLFAAKGTNLIVGQQSIYIVDNGLQNIPELSCGDTDGDGLSDNCDLDSDNDGCPDALEGDGGFLYSDLLNDTLTGGVDSVGVPLVAAGGQADVSSTDPNVQSRECLCHPLNPQFTDKDGDGVGDVCDLDNDNDGILDTVEGYACTFLDLTMPSTFGVDYLTHVNGTTVGPVDLSSTFGLAAGSVIVQIDNAYILDKGGLQDLWGISNGISPTITVSGTVAIKMKVIHGATNAIGIFDGFTSDTSETFQFTGILDPGRTSTMTTSMGIDTYRATNVSDATATNTGGPHIWESTNFYTNYSVVPFTNGGTPSTIGATYGMTLEYCGSPDTDSDGTPNHCDLDSDNDGCPDALEGDGGFLYSDLLNDTLTGGVDSVGVPLVAAGGQADVSSTDPNVQGDECDPCNPLNPEFTDKDGDGVGDVCDLDDDNDGILDTVECPSDLQVAAHTGQTDGVSPVMASLTTNGQTATITAAASGGASFATIGAGELFLFYEDLSGTFTYTSDLPLMEVEVLVGGLQATNKVGNFTATLGDGTVLNDMLISIEPTLGVFTASGFSTGPLALTTGAGGSNYVENPSTVIEQAESRLTFPTLTTEYLKSKGGLTSLSFALEDGAIFGPRAAFMMAGSICIDTDGDTAPNFCDLDSDNDGCPDADEAYGDTFADGDDTGLFGIDTPTVANGLVNNNGLVISAGLVDIGAAGSDDDVVYATTPATTTGGQNTFEQAVALAATALADDTTCVNSTAEFNSTLTVTATPTTTPATVVGTTTSDQINYVWQVSTDGGATFTDITAAGSAPIYTDFAGAETTGTEVTLGLSNVPLTANNYQYQVVATHEANICGAMSPVATLTVLPYADSTLNLTICQDDSTSINGKDYYSTTGVFVDTIAGFNCDSIVTLNLTVNPVFATMIDTTICSGTMFNSHVAPGLYVDSLLTTMGCDSIVTTRLPVSLECDSTMIMLCDTCMEMVCLDTLFNITDGNWTYCDGSTAATTSNGSAVIDTTSGCIIFTSNGVIGTDSLCVMVCDSATGTCDTTIIPVTTTCTEVTTMIDTTICSGTMFNSHVAPGLYVDSLLTTMGCDSIVTTRLPVSLECDSTMIMLCDTCMEMVCLDTLFNITDGNWTYCDGSTAATTSNGSAVIDTTSGCIVFTSNGVIGTDSLCVMVCDSATGTCDTTIIPVTTTCTEVTTMIDTTICSGTMFNSHVAPGLYIDSLLTTEGCDSIVTTRLPVSLECDSTIITLCDTCMEMVCLDTLFNITDGNWTYCDGSTAATTSNGSASIDTTSGCIIFTANGVIGTDSLCVMVCDSATGTCDTTIIPVTTTCTEVTTMIDTTICSGTMFNSHVAPGLYVDSLLTTEGCDSIVTTRLPVSLECDSTMIMLCDTCMEMVCLDTLFNIPDGNWTYCDGSTAATTSNGSASIDTTSGCIVFTSNGVIGTDSLCVMVCDSATGTCDTTIIPVTTTCTEVTTMIDTTICSGTMFNSHVAPGLYIDSLLTTEGCDSIVTTRLPVSLECDSTMIMLCDTCMEMVCLDTLFNITDGNWTYCDGSTAATTSNGSASIDTTSGCIVFTSNGVIGTDSLCVMVCDSATGTCDTTIIPVTTTCTEVTTMIDTTICSGTMFNSHVAPGLYIDSLLTTMGCDSIVTTRLPVSLECDSTMITLCDTCMETVCLDTLFNIPDGNWTYCDGSTAATTSNGSASIDTTSGCIVFTSNGVIGTDSLCVMVCDSATGTCDTTIIPVTTTCTEVTTMIDTTICSGTMFNSHVAPGLYIDSLLTTEGCDSIVTTRLPVSLECDSTMITLCDTCMEMVCLDTLFNIPDGNWTYCDGSTAATTSNGSASIDTTSGCIIFTANGVIGTDSLCVMVCDSATGTCDTTIIPVTTTCTEVTTMIDTTICSGTMFNSHVAPGLYIDSLLTTEGCDSIVTTRLPVSLECDSTMITLCDTCMEMVCLDTLFNITDGNWTYCDGSTAATTSNGSASIDTTSGCIIFTANGVIGTDSLCVMVCDSATGTCDTTIIPVTTTCTEVTTMIDTTICSGTMFNSHVAPGLYIDSLLTTEGCDSIVTTRLPVSLECDSTMIMLCDTCMEMVCLDTLFNITDGNWTYCDGSTAATTSNGSAVIDTTSGCIVFTSNGVIGTDSLCVVVCDSATGTCDTTIIPVTTTCTEVTTMIDTTICSGTMFNSHVAPGLYIDSLLTTEGCDSIVTTRLPVSLECDSTMITLCDTCMEMVCLDTLFNIPDGNWTYCDGSTAATTSNGSASIDTTSGCIIFTSNGVIGTDSLCVVVCDSATGTCDTTIIPVTTTCTEVTTMIDTTICSGTMFNSHVAPGLYVDSLLTTEGCDSIVTTRLPVSLECDSTIITLCDTCMEMVCLDTLFNITDGNWTYCDGSTAATTSNGSASIDTTSGCIIFTSNGVIGTDSLCVMVCDSATGTCDTTIIPVTTTCTEVTTMIDTTICSGTMFNSHVAPGLYIDSLLTTEGCDSIVTTRLPVSLECDSTMITLCDTCMETVCLDTLFNIPDGNWTYCDGSTAATTSNGSASIDTTSGCIIFTANGVIGTDSLCVMVCDSATGTCDTTIIPVTTTCTEVTTMIDTTICSGTMFNSHVAPGLYVDSLLTTMGCDSIVTTRLPVSLECDSTIITVCDTCMEMVCLDTLFNITDGNWTYCDGSTAATTSNGSASIDTTSGCIIFTANGVIGTDSLCVMVCDSATGTCDTTIIPVTTTCTEVTTMIDTTICSGTMFNSHVAPGLYIDSLLTTEGCDSIVTTRLPVSLECDSTMIMLCDTCMEMVCLDTLFNITDGNWTYCDGSTAATTSNGSAVIDTTSGCIVFTSNGVIGTDSLCVMVCDSATGTCDTTIIPVTTTCTEVTTMIDTTICSGTMFNSHVAPGLYIDSLLTTEGCDSIVTTRLPVSLECDSTIITLCDTCMEMVCLDTLFNITDGNWTYCDGSTAATTSNGSASIDTTSGCIIFTSNGVIGTDSLCVMVCDSATGTCDTTIIPVTTTCTEVTTMIDTTICSGTMFNSHVAPGLYIDSLLTTEGCDSIVTTRLPVSLECDSTMITLCDTCMEMVCLDTLFNITDGNWTYCDGSTAATTSNGSASIDTTSGCIIFTANGVIGTDSLCVMVCDSATATCDTTIIPVTTTCTEVTTMIDTTICSGTMFNSHVAPGLYVDSLLTTEGCDSIVTTRLPVSLECDSTIITLCDTCMEMVCLDTLFNITDGNWTYCDGSTAATTSNGSASIDTTSGCIIFTSNGVIGTDSLCVMVCDSATGTCDTTIIPVTTTCTEVTTMIDTTICSGTMFNSHVAPGLYIDSLLTTEGCDSIVTTRLPVSLECDSTMITLCDTCMETVCLDTLFNIPDGNWTYCDGSTAATTSNGSASIDTTSGCIIFTANGVIGTDSLCVMVCDSATGTCDTTIIPVTTTCTEVTTMIDTTICSGTMFNSHVAPGLYIDSLLTTEGCDSIVTTRLPVSLECDSTMIMLCDTCMEMVCLDTLFNITDGNWTYCDGSTTATTSNGSASIDTTSGCIVFTANGVIGTDSLCVMVCDSATGTCDTTIIPVTTTCTEVTTMIDTTICSGTMFNSHVAPGLYVDSLLTTQGCDSIVTTRLPVSLECDSTIITVCDTCMEMVCLDTLFNITDGNWTYCDGSTAATTSNGSASIDTTSGCIIFTANGVIGTDSLCVMVCDSATGTCDTTIIPVTTTCTEVTTMIDTTICSGTMFNSHVAPGLYIDSLLTTMGCDSIVTTRLPVSLECDSTMITLCDTCMETVCLDTLFNIPDGNWTYCDGSTAATTSNGSASIDTTSGCIVFTSNGVIGTDSLCVMVCDSATGTCDTTIIPVTTTCTEVTTMIDTTICSGTMFNSHVAPGLYVDSLLTTEGCDSIVTTRLPVSLECDSTMITLCDTCMEMVCLDTLFNITDGNWTYCDGSTAATTSNGSASIDTTSGCIIFTSNGVIGTDSLCVVVCDSATATCDTTIIPVTTTCTEVTTMIDTTICSGTMFNSHVAPGLYIDSLLTTEGCDSIVTTRLPVSLECDSTMITLCDTCMEMVCLDTLFNITDGNWTYCDGSTAATTSNGSASIDTTSGCIIFTSNGVIGTDSLCVMVCDSATGTCDTTIIPVTTTCTEVTTMIDTTICSGTMFNSHVAPGLYVDSLLTTEGCDSIVTTRLPVSLECDSTMITLCDTCMEMVCLDTLFNITDGNWTYCDGSTAATTSNGSASIDTTNGCIVFTANGVSGIDSLCVVVCDSATGSCDTTIITITVPLTPDTIPIIVPMDSTVTVCVDTTELPGTITSISTCGDPANGTTDNYDILTGCVDYSAPSIAGVRDTFCILVCDDMGFCDTTIITTTTTTTLTPDTIPIIVPMDSTVTVCVDTTELPGTITSISTCGDPANGTTDNYNILTGCVDYSAPSIAGVRDTFCILVCDDMGFCDTTIITTTTTTTLTPDTIPIIVPMDSTVTVCVDTTELPGTITSISTCGDPANGTTDNYDILTGCVDYSAPSTAGVRDTFCILVCDDMGFCDTTIITTTTTTTLTPDTIPIIVPMDSTVTVCVDTTELPGTITSISTCGDPANGTTDNYDILTGCVDYSAPSIAGVRDTFCILVCDDMGFCDTTIITTTTTTTLTPDTIPIIVPMDSTVTVCVDTTELPGTITSISTCGDPANGTTDNYDILTGCVDYSAPSIAGVRDTFCILVCDDMGFCDTTIITTTVPLTPDTIPIIVPMDSTVTVCVDTTELPGTITSISTCGDPANGTTDNYDILTGCVDYSAPSIAGVRDTFCILVCDDMGFCDTTIITTTTTTTLTPDTIPIIVPMDSTVTVCVDTTELPGTITSISTCGDPANGTTDNYDILTGCVDYSAPSIAGVRDTFCILVCDDMGFCDTTIITTTTTTTLTPDTIPIIVPMDSTVTVCVDTTELPGTITSISTCGDPANGTTDNYDILTGCVDYSAPSIAGVRDTFCILVCDDMGFCDTTIITTTVPLTPDTIPIIVPMDSTVTVCVDTTELPGTITSISTCGDPANGTTDNYDILTGCVDYSAPSIAGVRDTFCVWVSDVCSSDLYDDYYDNDNNNIDSRYNTYNSTNGQYGDSLCRYDRITGYYNKHQYLW